MPEPTPTPTTPTPAPAGGTVRVSLAPGTPAPTPTAQPTPDPAATDPAPTDMPPDDEAFTSDRQRRRFAELSGRVGVRERERDEARARVEHLLSRNAERIAATSLSEPGDLWLEGATVADLLTEDGSDVDADKVKAIVDALTAKRPGLKRPAEVRPLSGVHGVQQAIPARTTLADAVHRIARGREGL